MRLGDTYYDYMMCALSIGCCHVGMYSISLILSFYALSIHQLCNKYIYKYISAYDILEISTSAARDEIKQAYRTLSKTHHPDKGGDASLFHKINLAYRALSDETSRVNFEKYGHPDGPQTRTLSFAMPDWLLHPTGNVALVLVLLYLGAFVGLIVWVVKYTTRTEAAHAKKALETSVAGADAQYIATNLTPTSTHLEVLFYIATTPENIAVSQADISRADELRAKRREVLSKQDEDKNKTGGGFDDLDLDAGGWADDDEEDEETKRRVELAKKAEEEKAKEAKRLAAATGKANSAENVKLEGIDDGVLGQQWVENTLKKAGKWPPELGSLAKKTFTNEKGRAVSPMDNRAVRRNICMTMGRLNAMMLNTHPELRKSSAAIRICISVMVVGALSLCPLISFSRFTHLSFVFFDVYLLLFLYSVSWRQGGYRSHILQVHYGIPSANWPPARSGSSGCHGCSFISSCKDDSRDCVHVQDRHHDSR